MIIKKNNTSLNQNVTNIKHLNKINKLPDFEFSKNIQYNTINLNA